MIVYISVSNSEDKLTQREWSEYAGQVNSLIYATATEVHGAWTSSSAGPFQNACWCAVIPDVADNQLMDELQVVRQMYRQDSIAWASVERTTFL